jgi:hypothetical protein
MFISDLDIVFKRTSKAVFMAVIAVLTVSCMPEQDMPDGTVNGKRTPTVVSALSTVRSADGYLTLEGEITSNGKGTQIYDRGFYVSLASNDPGVADSVVKVVATSNRFAAEIHGLPGDTTLFWRAYAVNDYGIDLGEVKSVRTPTVIEPADDFRSQLRLRFASFSLGNSFFIVCGETNHGTLSELWEYNISNDKWWGNLPDFPGSQRRYPVAFTLDNRAFVGTGQRTFSEIYNDFYVFDGATRTWSDAVVTTIPGERYHATAFSFDGKAFVVGGSSFSSYLKDVWQISDSNGVYIWQRMNDFPVEIVGGISVQIDRNVYVGFSENFDAFSSLWKYNETDDEWELFCEMPEEVTTGFYSGAAAGKNLYFVDGENNIWQLNTESKAWTLKRSLPDAFSAPGSYAIEQNIFSIDGSNTLYIGVGFTELFYIYRPLWDN